MSARRLPPRPLLLATIAAALLASAVPAAAQASEEPAGAGWRLEQPLPPKAPPGTTEAAVPIALGAVGDIEFSPGEPGRGLLITHGNGETIPPGVWAYDGQEWREISKVCGATEGRIAWAGPDDFWTVSDGRPGQISESTGTGFEQVVPLQDNTLCHFAGGAVVGSYAHPAGQADSYQAMHAAACLPPVPPAVSSSNCWFAGDPLPEPQIGAFHLQWNGSSLEAVPYPGEAHPVWDMRALEGTIYESVRVKSSDRVAQQQSSYPVLHRIESLASPQIQPEEGELPLYGSSRELTDALDYLHLAASEGALWAAAGRSEKHLEPTEEAGQVTVARRVAGIWTQLLGPGSPAEGTPPNPLPHLIANEREEGQLLGGEASKATVAAIAAEPGSEDAWLALRPPNGTGSGLSAVLVHIDAEGHVLGEQTLPTAQERERGVGPKGAASRLACPAVEDCWLVTSEGWLFHLAREGERTLGRSELPGFEEPGVEKVIEFRPKDQGLPAQIGDAPPLDNSGEVEEVRTEGKVEEHSSPPENKVTLPLLSHVRARLIKGSTLQLSFHLAVKARVRLVAHRRRAIVAHTPTLTMRAGNRRLLLRLNPRAWPTKLTFQTRALAPLPVVSSTSGEGANVTTESTGLFALPHGLSPAEPDRLP
jgi:hypothetical protein